MGRNRKICSSFAIVLFLLFSIPFLSKAEQSDVMTQSTREPGSEAYQETEQVKEENRDESVRQHRPPDLIDIRLLSDPSLTAQHTTLANGRERITLNYTGHGALKLGPLINTYSIFHLPPELMNAISPENLAASYEVRNPAGNVRGRGSFRAENIHLDPMRNQVYINFHRAVFAGRSSYTFTLTIDLEGLLPNRTGEYVFLSDTTNKLVDLLVVSGNPARATLAAPQFPEAPVIHVPVYTTDTNVTGTGEPNTTKILQIGNEEYIDRVDAQGNFSVAIPAQEAGTEIRGKIRKEQGHESDEAVAVVIEAPDTIPSDAPIVDPVYSNDTIVTGRGEAGTTVVLTINGTEYEGTVDESGNYSIAIPTLEADTIISAVLIDEAGNVSESTEVTVMEATISFYRVPEFLSFDSAVIQPGIVRVPRQDPDWSLEVIDTRGPGSAFRVLAEAKQPLVTADGSHVLPEALVYVDEKFNSHSLLDGPVQVYAGQTGAQPITSIRWAPDRGPLVEVNAENAYAEDYAASITWTLVDAP